MYSYVICMSLVNNGKPPVCILMPSISRSYVPICHPYVTCMYLYLIGMSLVCTCMSSYVTCMYSMSSVRSSNVLVYKWFYHEPLIGSVTIMVLDDLEAKRSFFTQFVSYIDRNNLETN